MFWDQIQKKTLKFFWNFPKSFPKFQNGKLEVFWNFGFTNLKNTSALQKISKSKAMRISQNIFGILENSVVCNVSASFVLNCLHLSIICFHLLIRSVHFLARSSYLRTTFSLFSIHLSTYFCTHVVLLID